MNQTMTAQDIAQNMTKGEWNIHLKHKDLITADGKEVIVSSSGVITSESMDCANAQAIVTAVNATYGAGIDPGKIHELIITFQDAVSLLEEIGGPNRHWDRWGRIDGFKRCLSSIYIIPQP